MEALDNAWYGSGHTNLIFWFTSRVREKSWSVVEEYIHNTWESFWFELDVVTFSGLTAELFWDVPRSDPKVSVAFAETTVLT